MQQETNYLPLDNNYCVSATYNTTSKKVPFFSGTVISVLNYANKDMVNGKNQNKDSTLLCARVPDSSIASKLLVAPCFLPNLLGGSYWVIDAGPNDDNYEWAIISGGQPTVQYQDGCTTKKNSTNGSGFWFFTRTSLVNDTVIHMMKNIARLHGFTTSQLNPVIQKGCLYK